MSQKGVKAEEPPPQSPSPVSARRCSEYEPPGLSLTALYPSTPPVPPARNETGFNVWDVLGLDLNTGQKGTPRLKKLTVQEKIPRAIQALHSPSAYSSIYFPPSLLFIFVFYLVFVSAWLITSSTCPIVNTSSLLACNVVLWMVYLDCYKIKSKQNHCCPLISIDS